MASFLAARARKQVSIVHTILSYLWILPPKELLDLSLLSHPTVLGISYLNGHNSFLSGILASDGPTLTHGLNDVAESYLIM